MGVDSRAKEFGAYYHNVRSANTCFQYEQSAFRFELFLEEQGRDITQLKASDMESFVRWGVNNRKYKPSTISNYVIIARQYCEWLRSQGLKNVPQFEMPGVPRIQKLPKEILPDQFIPLYNRACIEYCKEPFRSALLLLPMCGLRVSELCALKTKDVELIPPSEAFEYGAAQLSVIAGKGGKSRLVPVLSEGLPVLVNYMLNVRAELPSSKWLFPDSNKKRSNSINRHQVKYKLTTIRDKIGIAKLHPHLLRHTYGTILNEAGVEGFDLAQIMGHANINVTSQYVHPVKNRLLQQVSQLSYRGASHVNEP